MNRDFIRFLCKLILFLAPLLALIGYAEVRLRRVPNGYNTKRAFLGRQLDSVEVLVLGSSHAYEGIDPNCLSLRAFNLAFVSQSLYYDTRLIRKYLDRMPRLQLVLVEINYFSLWYQLASTSQLWRDYFYCNFWGIRYRSLAWFDLRRVSYIALYSLPVTLQYARHNFNVSHLGNARAQVVPCPNGFGLCPADTTTDLACMGDSWGKARAQSHDATIEASHLSENTADLDTMLEELGRRHIRVVFVTLPVSDCYSRYLNPAINVRNVQVIDSLCSKHGCRRVDYLSDRRFVVSDFDDGDHLNFRGARKFSRILNHDIIADSTEP